MDPGLELALNSSLIRMRQSILIATLCVALFAPSEAAAQLGNITGVLRDAGTNAQIGGGVQAYRADGEPAQITGIFGAGPTTPYQIIGLLPGTYFLKATSTGYVTELHGDIACVAIDCPVTIATPVVVAAGATVTTDFTLSHGGGFTGTVRSASNNQTLPDVQVQVYNASTSFVKGVVTDFSGNYTVDELPPGTYFARTTTTPGISVQNVLHELYGGLPCPPNVNPTDPTALFRPDSACRIASGTPIAVTDGASTSGIDFSLDPSGTITGAVVADGTSAPLAGVSVVVFRGDVEIARTETTNGGLYIFAGLSPGSYRVRTALTQGNYVNEWSNGVCVGCADVPGAVTVGPGALVDGINFSLAPGGTITGTITCQFLVPNEWLRIPVIYAYNASGVLVRNTEIDSLESCLGLSAPTLTHSYALEGLPPGQYYLLARDVPANAIGIRPTGGLFIDVLYGDIVCMTVDCDVRRGVPVSVTSGGTTTGIDFTARQGASSSSVVAFTPPLHVYDARGVELVSSVRLGLGFSPIQLIVGLPPGTYFAKYGAALHGGVVCVECPPTSGTPIVIHSGDSSFPLDFGPTPFGHVVSGVVRDEAGAAPLSTITVEAFTNAGRLAASAITDLTGHYSIPAVQPGTYFLRTRNDRGFVDEIYPNVSCASCDVRSGTPVVVGAVDITGIDFTLATGGVVSGAVTDAAGLAVGNVPVSLFSGSGAPAGRIVASPAGLFRLTLPAGSYRARAEASASHGAEIFSEQPCTGTACDVTAGTPIAVTAGAITPNINFTLAGCTAMTLSPPLLASGATGHSYRQVFSTSGGAGPYVYRVTEGVLPLGLTLGASSGVLEGTPTVSGRHAFTVGVLDANGCAAARAFTLDVQGCAFTLSPSSATMPAAGGDITVGIADVCGPQTVTGLTFVSVQSNTVGQVVLNVAANTGAAARTNDITIGRRVFTVRQAGVASQPPFGTLDAPADGARVSGSIAVGGWALDDLEVSRVQIFRDPVGGEPVAQVFLGTAVFVAGARPDVAQAYPTYPLNNRAGLGLPDSDQHAARIRATARSASMRMRTTRKEPATLLGAKDDRGPTTRPRRCRSGPIDTPAQGETIAGSAYLNWGWALTPQPKIIPFDGSTIHVLVDGVPMGSPIYNLFRSDVSGLFPGLANSGGPVGYRVLDTTALAEGQHTIAWIVSDSVGAATGIGSRYFSVANSADAQGMALTSAGAKAEPPDDPSGVEADSVGATDCRDCWAGPRPPRGEPRPVASGRGADSRSARRRARASPAGERRGQAHGDTARARAPRTEAERDGDVVRW